MPVMTTARPFIPALAASILFSALLGATPQQQPPADQSQLPTFRTGANVVRVDVTVLDHRGQPVPALKPEDFLIEEDGVPQKVTSLKYVEANGQPTDDLSLPIRSPEHAAAEAAREDVRVFLIFWDEYSIDQFGSAIRARDALSRLLATAFQPTDLVALMDQLTPSDAIRFTRDFSDLSLDVKKLRGRLGVYIPARSAVEEAQMQKGDPRKLRAEVTASALKSAVVYLGTLREGRKAVIFVSEGIRGLGSDATQVLSDVVRAANESNTAIYTVDPRGLTGRGSSDSLFVLADNTGGRPVANTNGLDTAMRQIVHEASAFYLLGYSSIRNPSDGRFHQIKVRVDRTGLDVRARHGYWAPSLKAIDDARASAAAATPPDAVATAFSALTTTTSRHVLSLWTGIVRDAEGRPALSVAWAPRGQRGAGGGEIPAKVHVSATGGAEPFEFDGTVDARGPTFAMPPGAAKVTVSVRDAEDRVIDTEVRTITVPSVEGAGMVWSTPVLLRARTPIEVRTMIADPDAPPFASNELSRADRLLVRTVLFGTSADTVVTSRLVSHAGRDLVALPVAPLANRPGTYQVDLPLSSVAPGEYVIALRAKRGTETVDAFVSIRVTG